MRRHREGMLYKYHPSTIQEVKESKEALRAYQFCTILWAIVFAVSVLTGLVPLPIAGLTINPAGVSGLATLSGISYAFASLGLSRKSVFIPAHKIFLLAFQTSLLVLLGVFMYWFAEGFDRVVTLKQQDIILAIFFLFFYETFYAVFVFLAVLVKKHKTWVAQAKALAPFRADVSKIHWEKAEDQEGPYEKSQDINNPDHKELLKMLGATEGSTFYGYIYWILQDGSTIGRRPKKKKAST